MGSILGPNGWVTERGPIGTLWWDPDPGEAVLQDGRRITELNVQRAAPGTVVCDWTPEKGALSLSAPTAGQAAELDPNVRWMGSPALKVTNVNATLVANYILTTPISLSSLRSLTIPIRTSWNGRYGAVAIWMQTTTGKQVRANLTTSPARPFEWMAMSVSRDSDAFTASFGAGGDATTLAAEDVARFSIVLVGNADAQGYPFWIGPLYQDVRDKVGRICIAPDAGYPGQFTYLRPLLRGYGFRSSISLLTRSATARMTDAQLAAMYDDGNEFTHHTGDDLTVPSASWSDTTKYPTDGTATQRIAADIQITWDYLTQKGWTRGIGHAVSGFSNPFNGSVSAVRQGEISAALRLAGVKSLRSFNTYASGVRTCPTVFRVATDPLALTGGQIQVSATTAATIKAIIDAVELRGESAFITLHDIVLSGASGNTTNIAIAEDWMAHLAAKSRAGTVKVVTQSELYSDVFVND